MDERRTHPSRWAEITLPASGCLPAVTVRTEQDASIVMLGRPREMLELAHGVETYDHVG